MTILTMMAKGLTLTVLALAAFAALAVMLGYEPAAAENVAQCDARPVPACLFTIL